MPDPLKAQLERLKHSMAALETQRAMLGDDAVDPAISLLKSQIASLEARLGGETSQPEDRRIVTIFFSDIVGSTQLAEGLDPEDWRETVAAVHSMAGRKIRDHAGIVVQYLGDGLLALFGAQLPSERDPERAVRAALDIQAGIDSIKTSLPVQLRVGIHTGLVVTGEMGSDAKREFTASGDAMNRASILQSAAPPGGILISRATYRHVRGYFDVSAQAPLEAKGIADPLQSYLILRARTRPYKAVTRGVRGVDTNTVGRETEERRLLSLFNEAVEKRGVVWAQLVGEPGVGKTRMLTDIAERLDLSSQDLHWLRACASDDDARQPFSLVRRMWFDHFQIADDLPISEVEDRWFEGCIRLGGKGYQSAAEAFGLLIGLPPGDRSTAVSKPHNPMQIKGRGFAVGRELISLLRDVRPLVILVEDLQWADQSSWDYIVEVLLDDPGREARNGLFILATARSEWDPPQALLDFPGYRQIALSPLPEAASRDLVAELLQHVDRIPDEVTALIVERAEGVPYFAEEIVNWLLDRGAIDRRFQPWRFVAERFDDVSLPETLQHLLFTRLSSLDKSQQEILQRGAIYGRNFWEGGLIALDSRVSGEWIGDLEQKGFIKEQPVSTFSGEREWSFYHDLMRAVAYESVLKRKRPKLHQAAGTWLEALARESGRLDEFAGRIGNHAELAGDPDGAADWYFHAGERAWSQGAITEARDFLNRTLALLPHTARERRWRVLLKRDEVLSLLAEKELRQEGITSLLEMAREFEDPDRLAEAFYRQGVLFDSVGDPQRAIGALESALELAREAKNRSLEALVLAFIVMDKTRLGDLKTAAGAAEEALSIAQGLDDDAALARILNNVAISFTESGDLGRAASLFERQIEVFRSLGDKAHEAIGRGNLGYIYTQLGMFEKGRDTMEIALRLNEAVGARRACAYNLLNLALAHWRMGDSHSAQAQLERAQPMITAIGEAFGSAIRISYLALSQEKLGDLNEAAESFRQARSELEALGLHGFARDCLAGMARCALAQGHAETAGNYASDLWAHLSEHGAGGLEFPIVAYSTCAKVFETMGLKEKSRAALAAGHHELMTRADKISDEEWRNRYLEDLPEHRAIREMWNQVTGKLTEEERGMDDG